MNRTWHFISTVLGVIFRHPMTAVTLIPILPNGQIVLTRRRDDGLWSLPGGIIDWGDDILTTAHQELAEETGLELVKINRLVGVYSSPKRDPRLHSIAVLIAIDVQGIPQVKDSLEIIEVKAFSKEELPTLLSHDHAQQLQDYFQGLTIVA